MKTYPCTFSPCGCLSPWKKLLITLNQVAIYILRTAAHYMPSIRGPIILKAQKGTVAIEGSERIDFVPSDLPVLQGALHAYMTNHCFAWMFILHLESFALASSLTSQS